MYTNRPVKHANLYVSVDIRILQFTLSFVRRPNNTATSTNANKPRAACPICWTKPTAALLEHSEKAALPSQTKAINDFRAAEAATKSTTENPQAATPAPSLEPSMMQPAISTPTSSSKQAHIEEISDDDECEDARTNPKSKKPRKSASRTDSDLVGEDGILIDIDVQSIADTASTRELRTADIEESFGTTFEHTRSNGKVKKHRKCKFCRKQCMLVNETTTLRRHAEANFAGKYCTWAKQNSFESMLPGDVKARKDKAEHEQQIITSHLTERKIAEHVVPYVGRSKDGDVRMKAMRASQSLSDTEM
ncbi:uncharacterized protein HD556DRAFT_1313686 [Suillus plorans]|uniref:Uncharacterized protein n=1 Tax=Suillus plorans TaxID=116603 RepID=A0A9P7ABN0_9AGAM|nr:uncharacterized protein HD556DRAFT_1313686 [Suillus plorans]KAG1786128.1 hypothetical protein HD556DRAFT_1313686 [Suillus plorans]